MAPFNSQDYTAQVRAGVIGHALGDALGVPVEFMYRKALAVNPVTGMIGHGTHDVPAGTWSDDTSMEIGLMRSLIDKQGFDYHDIMSNFYKWYNHGEFTATGVTFDVGNTCSRAIRAFSEGTTPLECGGSDRHSNGNGSLMRILPVALVCHHQNITGKRRYELVRKVSSLTHAHPISVLGCYIYVNFVCHLLDGNDPATAYAKMQQEDYTMVPPRSAEAFEYDQVLYGDITERLESKISSTGYVVNSLEAALWCLLTTKSYREAVLKAVNLGGDTDTIGAVTGSMAGICYGYDALPQEWLDQLRLKDYLLELCDQFATVRIRF